MKANFHLAPAVPAIESTGLAEVADVVGGTLNAQRGEPELEPAMSPVEITRRAAEFIELRRAGMLRRRA